jgi:hypothetical protein
MVHWGFRFFESSRIDLLKKIFAIIGCLVFLFSFVSPFCFFRPVRWFEESSSLYYWSFKIDVQHYWLGSPTGFSQYWFHDYWFSTYVDTYSGLSWVLVFMFMAQILTLVTGIASIFTSNRIVALIPIILCPTTIALMLHVKIKVSETPGFFSYQQGYWLTYPSMSLFLLSFILGLVMRKRDSGRNAVNTPSQ